MKQIVMQGPRKSRVVEVPMPEFTADQLLVKVTYTDSSRATAAPGSAAEDTRSISSWIR